MHNGQDAAEHDPHDLVGHIWSHDRIAKLAGVTDLALLTSLTIQVDTKQMSLSPLGACSLVPNLRYLDVSNSLIASLRDMGSSWRKLEILKIASSKLCGLEGIHGCPKLKELHAANNSVSELGDVSFVEDLVFLDLARNGVADMAEVESLALCPSLRVLVLEQNPVAVSLDGAYRARVCKTLPHLERLDGAPVSTTDIESSTVGGGAGGVRISPMPVHEYLAPLLMLTAGGSASGCTDGKQQTPGRPATPPAAPQHAARGEVTPLSARAPSPVAPVITSPRRPPSSVSSGRMSPHKPLPPLVSPLPLSPSPPSSSSHDVSRSPRRHTITAPLSPLFGSAPEPPPPYPTRPHPLSAPSTSPPPVSPAKSSSPPRPSSDSTFSVTPGGTARFRRASRVGIVSFLPS
ncbi:Leucine-rich repeat-containing protein 56 [Sorochytrium milnesiophthora]